MMSPSHRWVFGSCRDRAAADARQTKTWDDGVPCPRWVVVLQRRRHLQLSRGVAHTHVRQLWVMVPDPESVVFSFWCKRKYGAAVKKKNVVFSFIRRSKRPRQESEREEGDGMRWEEMLLSVPPM